MAKFGLFNVPIDREISNAIDSIPNHVNAYGFDNWGLNPESAKLYYTLAKGFYRYFHPSVEGISNVPKGRVLLVPNHAGQIAYDGMVIATAMLLHGTPPRLVRAMAERWLGTIPFLNEWFSRTGVVLGDPINCRNLLQDDQAILVFPEGARGSGKVWADRYRLRDFGRGFMRLALQTRTPIVPISVVGSEESIISLYDWQFAAKRLRAPYFPISPWLPFLGPFAYAPLPTKFYIDFGEPLYFDGPFDDEDSVIQGKVEVVQSTIQRMIDKRRELRGSKIF